MIILCIALLACVVTAAEKTQDNTVIHIVLIWLKDQGNQEHIQQVIDGSNQLREIPGLQEMRVGKSISSDREIVDDSFDVGLYMVFKNEIYLQRYLVHPVRQSVVKKVLIPLSKKIRVHDFEEVKL